MQYELSEQQVKNLISLISNAQIRGAEAPIILDLAKALRQPLVQKKPKDNSKE